ncbi:helix-turn-helix transcriptional regulator [Enterococcus faecalis]|uniref:helix-turn-helix transcriptional regulator n=1 Tax=Enterococcus TaxID=1350 RepID=UPI0019EBC780|nr:helix-turn-helix transcriptional regulator [Enterococcus avium]EGO2640996.1 helix-turn-helix transcriptional regulator [Enterococcus faecalis]MDT2381501.1 helix-turn-helix transcriptional regulator [Enterococcus avium]MDT2386947.1 helix-turn-helix transcriptional regulator [Enterococcus avium]
MKPNPKKTGHRIKQLRLSMGLTMDALGKKLDNSPRATVSNWERGVNLPNPNKLKLLSDLSGSSIDWIKWGTLEDYINSYLSQNGYNKFIDDFPETSHHIYLELFNKYSDHYSMDDNYELLNRFINSIFIKDYLPIFQDYAIKLIKTENLDLDNNMHSINIDTFEKKFYAHLFEELSNNNIKYGDDKQIIKIATDLLQKMDKAYKVINKYSSVDDYFHAISENQFEIEKFLLDLSKRYNFPYEKNSKTAKLLLDNHENFK